MGWLRLGRARLACAEMAGWTASPGGQACSACCHDRASHLGTLHASAAGLPHPTPYFMLLHGDPAGCQRRTQQGQPLCFSYPSALPVPSALVCFAAGSSFLPRLSQPLAAATTVLTHPLYHCRLVSHLAQHHPTKMLLARPVPRARLLLPLPPSPPPFPAMPHVRLLLLPPPYSPRLSTAAAGT